MKIGTFWGIPLKVHWTFGILMLFVVYSAFTNNLKTWQSFGFIGLIIVLFLCVVLHEYGHALVAKRMGIKTQDIILSPIGGVARLTNIPENPWQEFLIAIAGPSVNLVLGGLLALALFFYDGIITPEVRDLKFNEPIEILRYIVWMNGALFFFNLIPAFPMDGGRVLRALLAIKFGHFKATQVATFIGRVLAVGFIVFGVFNQQLVLAMIGLVIFMMAGKEYAQSKINHIFKTATVAAVMRHQYSKIHVNDPYQRVIDLYNDQKEFNFLVYDSSGNIVGAVPELFIKDAIKNIQPTKMIGEMMSQKIGEIPRTMILKDLLDQMQEKGITIATVIDHEQVIGVVDRHDIEQFIIEKSS